jgi:3-methylfumaryl-CoA hydratase
VDALAAAPGAAVCAVTGLLPATNEVLPPFWHWLHFLSWPAHDDLGDDGHPSRGHFYPPVPDRRRMVAGGRLEVRTPLAIGEPAQRETSLVRVEVKQGGTGELAFVTLRHVISQAGMVRVVEEHDLVYRQGAPMSAGPAVTPSRETPVADEPWQHLVTPDSRMLFRFSALTANAHRIHYDAPYARGVEGFPGLVVHGPLLVLHMLDLARRYVPERRVSQASYRMRAPVFCDEPVLAVGTPLDSGTVTMRIATARDPRHATAEVSLT